MKVTSNNCVYDTKTVECLDNQRAAITENIVAVNEKGKWFNIENINEHSTENELVTIKASPNKEKLSVYTRTQKSGSLFIRSQL